MKIPKNREELEATARSRMCKKREEVTPGPWVASQNGDIWYAHSQGYVLVAETKGRGGVPDRVRLNACLIAAAPDLLAAAKAIRDIGICPKTIDALHAAIEKAEGQKA